jgi:L-ascorbate metabolism protein UlaG (beta-lactamase superfamily)
MAEILYQGHASLRLTAAGGQVIYVDPYAGEGYEKPADLILVTHEHFDHNQVGLVRLKEKGKIIRAKDVLAGGNYLSFDLGFVRFQAVPASNAHHDIRQCVGFLLQIDGRKLYLAGDTSFLPFMQERLPSEHLDYAFLPTDGIYNMGPEEAGRCAQLICAKKSIPIHMDPEQPFNLQIASRFLSSCQNGLILRPGETLKV